MSQANDFKIKDGTFRLGTRKKLFTMRVVRCWNSLNREILDAPPLEMFKAGLDGALGHLVGGIPAHGGDVGTQHDLPSPFQTKPL